MPPYNLKAVKNSTASMYLSGGQYYRVTKAVFSLFLLGQVFFILLFSNLFSFECYSIATYKNK